MKRHREEQPALAMTVDELVQKWANADVRIESKLKWKSKKKNKKRRIHACETCALCAPHPPPPPAPSPFDIPFVDTDTTHGWLDHPTLRVAYSYKNDRTNNLTIMTLETPPSTTIGEIMHDLCLMFRCASTHELDVFDHLLGRYWHSPADDAYQLQQREGYHDAHPLHAGITVTIKNNRHVPCTTHQKKR